VVDRVSGERAFVLHRRPYRESSAIVDLLSEQHGRVAVVVRGMQRRRSPLAAMCQPMQCLRVDWRGRSELKTLVQAERIGFHVALDGVRLYSLLYGNELLMRCLPPNDPCPGLFHAYYRLLQALAGSGDPEPGLRRFELDLLEELGYALELDRLGTTQASLDPDGRYRLQADLGVVAVADTDPEAVYAGATLMAIQRGDFSDPLTRRAAKRLLREALRPLVGERPLFSRELFRRRLQADEDGN
jgi:DNA repair protein RecO (recombination protein O)